MKNSVLVAGLLLLLVANLIMVYYAPYGLVRREGFQNIPAPPAANAPAPAANAPAPAANAPPAGAEEPKPMPMANSNVPASDAAPAPAAAPAANGTVAVSMEGFASYFLENAGGSKETYSPIGAYDGVKLSTGNSVSGWRYTAPNEPLMGPAFEPGPDSLFMFKNNQCKPECCGASFSCGGGCVCTTPQQRQYIAGRGGNRTAPEDSA